MSGGGIEVRFAFAAMAVSATCPPERVIEPEPVREVQHGAVAEAKGVG
jgi:hypothetical protein